jgi:hypothetical protein
VDADDGVPFLLAHVEDHPVTQDAGVVHQDVEPALLGDGGVDQRLDRVEVRDIGRVGDGATAAGGVACFATVTRWIRANAIGLRR